MTRKLALAAALLGTVSAPIAASAVTRDAEPASGANGLGGGQSTLFFLAGIAVVALAVVLLPEDQPTSP